MSYRVLLFDLFRTVMLFDPAAPTGRVKEPTWRSAMAPLRRVTAELAPTIRFDDLLDAFVAVHADIAAHYPPGHYEVSSRERYRRALLRLGVSDPGVPEIAEQLSLAQMSLLAAHAHVPDAHGALLRELARTYRLALVSNFDHAPTVHALLAQHGLRGVFAAILISIEFGQRKPHAEIFREALARLDAEPAAALHVGDAYVEDVTGARAAGIDVAWLNPNGTAVPPGGPPPTYTIRRLTDVRALLTA
jgi:HAD superfamily hydrolase (TIGR01549 family)